MVTTPITRSAEARLHMRWLKGQCRFLWGSIIIARINRRLPGIFGIISRIEITTVKNDRAVGAPCNWQTFSNFSCKYSYTILSVLGSSAMNEDKNNVSRYFQTLCIFSQAIYD